MQSLGDHSAGSSSTPLSAGNIVNAVRCPARNCHRSRSHRHCPRQMCRSHCLSHGGCPSHVLDGVNTAAAILKVTPISVNLAQPLVADAVKFFTSDRPQPPEAELPPPVAATVLQPRLLSPLSEGVQPPRQLKITRQMLNPTGAFLASEPMPQLQMSMRKKQTGRDSQPLALTTSAPTTRRPKVLESSHFFAFPMISNPIVLDKIKNFQDYLDSTSSTIRGFDKSIAVAPERLHITIGVVGLEQGNSNDPNLKTVENVIQLVESLKPDITKILRGKTKLRIPLDKLNITQKEESALQEGTFAHVLYVGPSSAYLNETNGIILSKIMNLVYKALLEKGYITENRSSKVHCSILNTRYRRPRVKKPFSYSDILGSPACKWLNMSPTPRQTSSDLVEAQRSFPSSQTISLGTVKVDRIHLYKMGSHGQNNEYISCGVVRLADT